MNDLPQTESKKSRLRLPLYSKILLWFVVNLVLVGGIVLFYIRVNFAEGFDWVLSGPASDRLQLIASYLHSVLATKPQSEWPEVVDHFGDYLDHPVGGWEVALKGRHPGESVAFALFLPDGTQVVGRPVEVPVDIKRRLTDKREPEARPRPLRRDDMTDERLQPPKPRFVIRSEEPVRYWAGIHSDITWEREGRWYPLTFVIISSDITAGGLLFDWWPWVSILVLGIGISALLWVPVVGGITRHIRRTNDASKRIAAGQFDVRLPEGRSDELGELASAVNAMASQLGDYVREQKRITADVAHELCSPIARMQMALGLVEQRGTPDQQVYLQKLDKELQHMAKLVEEVLAFSKASSLPEREAPEDFSLCELIAEVVAREAADAGVKVDAPDVSLHTLRKGVDRALGNVIRNAVRYAKDVQIEATMEDNPYVEVRVLDRGPGVSEEALPRLFEPFYRPEAARGRNTGGSGLGLAIARRCIEACGGKVTAANRAGGGFCVSLKFPAKLGAS